MDSVMDSVMNILKSESIMDVLKTSQDVLKSEAVTDLMKETGRWIYTDGNTSINMANLAWIIIGILLLGEFSYKFCDTQILF